jgi:hypothetical protein
MILLTVTINGVHESAHAMQSHVTVASDQASASEISASHQCPCTPLEQHKDYDGCNTCVNCTCHAPLTIQPFQLSYNPSVLDDLYASAPFNFLPEVYLSLFVPPDSATV